MILRSERHRELLADILNKMTFPGALARDVVELQAEVATAALHEAVPSPPNGGGHGAQVPATMGSGGEQ